jgi:O-antigen ligase
VTASKGALVWSLAGIFVGVASARHEKFRNLGLISIPWIVLVAGINFAAVLVLEWFDVTSLRTLLARIEFLIASANIFADHPIRAVFGGGIRYWSKYSYLLASYDYPNAHNVYLNQILMYGLVGFFLFFLFFVSVVGRSVSGKDEVRGLFSPYPYIGAIFALTGSYFFEPSFSNIVQKFQFLFLLSVLMSLPGRDYQTK